MPDCLFCKIVAGEVPAKLLCEDEHIIVFKDINPQAPVHNLIIPKQHIATINDLDSENEGIIGRMYLAAKKVAAQEGISDTGYRTVMNCGEMAGQTVFHIHLHVLGGRALAWPPG